jgi:hypothetical protein
MNIDKYNDTLFIFCTNVYTYLKDWYVKSLQTKDDNGTKSDNSTLHGPGEQNRCKHLYKI